MNKRTKVEDRGKKEQREEKRGGEVKRKSGVKERDGFTDSWLMKGEGWEGRFLILLFFLSMMPPVEPGLPHACLSPQTQHGTLFPMQLSNLLRPSPSNNSAHTQKDNTHWRVSTQANTYLHTQRDTVEPATPATFPNQHTFLCSNTT